MDHADDRELVTCTPEGDLARQAARALVGEMLRTGWWMLPVGLVVIALAAFAVVREPVVVAVLLAVAVAVTVPFTFWDTARRIRRLAPEGAYAAQLRATELWLRTPLGESSVAYRAFSRVRRSGDVVLLRQRGTSVTFVVPAGLFPGGLLDELRARTDAAAG